MARDRFLQDTRGQAEHGGYRAIALLLILLALLGIAAYAQYVDVNMVIVQLAYVPILLAAAVFELPGGLFTALVTAALLSSANLGEAWNISWFYRAGLLVGFGGLSGFLAQLVRRRMGVADQKVQRFSELYHRVLSSLATIVEKRDEHIRGHCDRVAINALVMGRALDFDDEELETLYWAGLLHDLGKVGVREAILLKPGPLTADEYVQVKHHPEYGAGLLESISPEFNGIAEVVRHHHERWDGQGYPAGLSSEAIPQLSRVIAVVDVFEALTSERPYRQPMCPVNALAYLTAEVETHFDPVLVELFEDLYHAGDIEVAGAEQPQTVVHSAATTAPVSDLIQVALSK